MANQDYSDLQLADFSQPDAVTGNRKITVATAAQLDNVIEFLDGPNVGGNFEIDITNTITDTGEAPLSLDGNARALQNANVNLTIDSLVHSTGGGGSPQALISVSKAEVGFQVNAGNLRLENLEIDNTPAGTADAPSTALLIEGGHVTTQNVLFLNNVGTADGTQDYGGDVILGPEGSLSVEGSSSFSTERPATGYGGIVFAGSPRDSSDPAVITLGQNSNDGRLIEVDSLIADGSGLGLAPAGEAVGQLVIGGQTPTGVVCLDPSDSSGSPASNLYTGGTKILTGELQLGFNGAAGSGSISFGNGSGPDDTRQVLEIDHDLFFKPDGNTFDHLENTLSNFGQNDFLVIDSLPFDAETSSATFDSSTDTLTVKNANTTDVFQLSNPAGTTFDVKSNGDFGTVVYLAPGSTSSGGGSTSGSGGGTGSGQNPPAGNSPNPPSNNGLNPPSNNTAGPSVAFNPNISVAPGDVVTLSGIYAGAAGVPSILISEDGSALGLATVNPNGTWSLTVDYTALPGPHINITATATDSQGRQATSAAPFDLVTDYSHVKPDGYPYRTVQNNYDSTGAYTGSVFFNRSGTEYYESTYHNTASGGSVYNYSGGTYFNNKDFSSFSDSYNIKNIDIYNSDGELTRHTESNNDGTRTVDVYAHRDILNAAPGSTRFVFDPGVGHATINNFSTTGAQHDSIEIGQTSAATLARILQTQADGDGNLTLHLGHGDVVTLTGVDHVTKRDFTHLT